MMQHLENYQRDLDDALPALDLAQLANKRIFLTGVTGMIVSTVADLLLRWNEKHNGSIELYFAGRSKERVKQRFPSFCEGEAYHFVSYDALQPFPEDIPAMDFFIHGAGNADPHHYDAEPVETMMTNLDGLYRILYAARNMDAERVLYISSGEVYGNRESEAPFGERDYGDIDLLNPRACYPSAKRAAETLCAAFSKEYSVDTVIVRPCHIYGPSITATDSRASAQFTRSAARHEDIVLKSDGQTLRSYCYTIDCAAAILTVLLKGKTGESYNIASHTPVTIRQLAEAFANAGGGELRFENPSDREQKSYNMMHHSVLDGKKLETLGWSEQFAFPVGVEKTLEYVDGQA